VQRANLNVARRSSAPGISVQARDTPEKRRFHCSPKVTGRLPNQDFSDFPATRFALTLHPNRYKMHPRWARLWGPPFEGRAERGGKWNA